MDPDPQIRFVKHGSMIKLQIRFREAEMKRIQLDPNPQHCF